MTSSVRPSGWTKKPRTTTFSGSVTVLVFKTMTITLNYILGDMILDSICVIAVLEAILQVGLELNFP